MKNRICPPAWLSFSWNHCCRYSSQIPYWGTNGNLGISWRSFDHGSSIMQQVLCSEQLGWPTKARLSSLCRNHSSYSVAIHSSDWTQSEKNHCDFLHFPSFYYLWLLEWKAFWVIKHHFLFWQANIWSYFSGLSYFPVLLVALVLHVCPNWKCQWKIEMFHFSLKK